MITSADGFGQTDLLVGTSDGDIAIASRVKNIKTGAAVKQVLCLNERLALVFYERSSGRRSAAVFELPDLTQIQKLSLHDCVGGCVVAPDTVAVYTPAAVRLLRFEDDSARLLKTIEYKGIVAACSQPRLRRLLVATDSEYTLLSLKTGTPTPLFPIAPDVTPVMCAVGADFLVVQGTGMFEPAMGLFVNARGDVARKGMVVQWDAYPTSICAAGDLIFATVNKTLVVLRLVETTSGYVAEIQSADELVGSGVADVAFVTRLDQGAPVTSPQLLARFGDETISKVHTHVAIAYDSGHIELCKSLSPPPLVAKEQRIAAGELKAVDPEPEQAGSVQGVAELEYLNQFLVLNLLSQGDVASALREWHACLQLDAELVLYIFHEQASDSRSATTSSDSSVHTNGAPGENRPKVYPGLVELVEKLRASCGGPQGRAFLLPYLKMKLRALKRSPSTTYSCGNLELVYARTLARGNNSKDELIRFLLSKDLRARDDVISMLKEIHAVDILVEFYRLSGRRQQLAELYFDVLKQPDASGELADEAAESLAGELSDCVNLWELVHTLILLPHCENRAMMVLTNNEFEHKYPPRETLEMLKQQSDSGRLWRRYLKYLVHEREMFHDDLATLVVADLMEQYSTNTEAIERVYTRFASLPWPKPSFDQWVTTLRPQEYSTELMALQSELWELLRHLQPTPEASWLISSVGTQMPLFKHELALIHQMFGLHEQAQELHLEITDYRSIIEYASQYPGSDNELLRRDLAAISLRLIGATATPAVLRELLLVDEQYYTAPQVLAMLPASTPVYAVASFLKDKITEALQNEQGACMVHATAKSAANSQKNKIK